MTAGTDGAQDRPTVELERVTKRFGDFTAVRELDLTLGMPSSRT